MSAGKVRLLWAGGVAAAMVGAVVATAIAVDGNNVKGNLKGYQEVPAVSTGAKGSFRASLAPGGAAINYKLTYAGLEDDATQAHIHFGQKGVNGGISVWFCSNLPAPSAAPAGTPPCPLRSATLTGTIRAGDVIGPAGQGIAAGELRELLRAIRRGFAYANVHSKKFPGGEVRAQLRRSAGDYDPAR